MQLKENDEAGYGRFMDAVTARKAELATPASDFPGDAHHWERAAKEADAKGGIPL